MCLKTSISIVIQVMIVGASDLEKYAIYKTLRGEWNVWLPYPLNENPRLTVLYSGTERYQLRPTAIVVQHGVVPFPPVSFSIRIHVVVLAVQLFVWFA